MNPYEVIILGGGSAGIAAARRAAESEGKVILVEPSKLGGVGYHMGPAPFLLALRQLENEGNSIDWTTVKQRVETISRETEKRLSGELDGLGVEVLVGTGTLLSASSVLVSGKEEQTLQGDNIILATGSVDDSPVTMPIDELQILASDRLSLMDELPSSICLVGASPTGMAWAWVFACLGAKVFLCDEQQRLWQGQDPQLMDGIEKVMKSRKVKLLSGKKIVSLLKEKNSITLSLDGGIQFKTETMAFCSLRKADVSGLGVDTLNAEVSPSGAVFADDAMLTSVPGVFAAGSLTGHERRIELSEEEGRVAGANACGKKLSLKEHWVPRIFKGDPPLGSVGCYFEDAHHHGFRGVEGKGEWIVNPLNPGTAIGWVKVVADKDSKRVVGGQAFGTGSLELVSLLNLAVRKGLSPRDLAQMVTSEESPFRGLQEAARICFRKLSDKR